MVSYGFTLGEKYKLLKLSVSIIHRYLLRPPLESMQAAEEVTSMRFGIENSPANLYTESIERIFTALKQHFPVSIDACEKKYAALLEAAMTANAHKTGDKIKHRHSRSTATEGGELDKPAAEMQSYRDAIMSIKERGGKARRHSENIKVGEVISIGERIDEIRKAKSRNNKTYNMQQLLPAAKIICQEANINIRMEIGVNDHDMASIVQKDGLNVPNHLNESFAIATSNGRENLDEQLSRPELRAAWNNLVIAPVGTATDLSDDDKTKLNVLGRSHLHQAFRTAYERTLLKLELKKHQSEALK